VVPVTTPVSALEKLMTDLTGAVSAPVATKTLSETLAVEENPQEEKVEEEKKEKAKEMVKGSKETNDLIEEPEPVDEIKKEIAEVEAEVEEMDEEELTEAMEDVKEEIAGAKTMKAQVVMQRKLMVMMSFVPDFNAYSEVVIDGGSYGDASFYEPVAMQENPSTRRLNRIDTFRMTQLKNSSDY